MSNKHPVDIDAIDEVQSVHEVATSQEVTLVVVETQKGLTLDMDLATASGRYAVSLHVGALSTLRAVISRMTAIADEMAAGGAI